MPASFATREMVEAGLLMSYEPSRARPSDLALLQLLQDPFVGPHLPGSDGRYASVPDIADAGRMMLAASVTPPAQPAAQVADARHYR